MKLFTMDGRNIGASANVGIIGTLSLPATDAAYQGLNRKYLRWD